MEIFKKVFFRSAVEISIYFILLTFLFIASTSVAAYADNISQDSSITIDPFVLKGDISFVYAPCNPQSWSSIKEQDNGFSTLNPYNGTVDSVTVGPFSFSSIPDACLTMTYTGRDVDYFIGDITIHLSDGSSFIIPGTSGDRKDVVLFNPQAIPAAVSSPSVDPSICQHLNYYVGTSSYSSLQTGCDVYNKALQGVKYTVINFKLPVSPYNSIMGPKISLTDGLAQVGQQDNQISNFLGYYKKFNGALPYYKTSTAMSGLVGFYQAGHVNGASYNPGGVYRFDAAGGDASKLFTLQDKGADFIFQFSTATPFSASLCASDASSIFSCYATDYNWRQMSGQYSPAVFSLIGQKMFDVQKPDFYGLREAIADGLFTIYAGNLDHYESGSVTIGSLDYKSIQSSIPVMYQASNNVLNEFDVLRPIIDNHANWTLTAFSDGSGCSSVAIQPQGSQSSDVITHFLSKDMARLYVVTGITCPPSAKISAASFAVPNVLFADGHKISLTSIYDYDKNTSFWFGYIDYSLPADIFYVIDRGVSAFLSLTSPTTTIATGTSFNVGSDKAFLTIPLSCANGVCDGVSGYVLVDTNGSGVYSETLPMFLKDSVLSVSIPINRYVPSTSSTNIPIMVVVPVVMDSGKNILAGFPSGAGYKIPLIPINRSVVDNSNFQLTYTGSGYQLNAKISLSISPISSSAMGVGDIKIYLGVYKPGRGVVFVTNSGLSVSATRQPLSIINSVSAVDYFKDISTSIPMTDFWDFAFIGSYTIFLETEVDGSTASVSVFPVNIF